MRFIFVCVLVAACGRPKAPEAPRLPDGGDLADREAIYQQSRVTVSDGRVTRADGSYRAHMFIPLYDATPRAHGLIHRHDSRKLAAAVLSTVAAVATIVALGSFDEQGRGNAYAAPLLIGSAGLQLTAAGLILASPFPSAEELATAYNADLRDQLGIADRR